MCLLVCFKQADVLCGGNRIILSSEACAAALFTALAFDESLCASTLSRRVVNLYGEKREEMWITLLSGALYSKVSPVCHSSDNKMVCRGKSIHHNRRNVTYTGKKKSIQSQQIHNRATAVSVFPTQYVQWTLCKSLLGSSL